jgi:hypothetical protein
LPLNTTADAMRAVAHARLPMITFVGCDIGFGMGMSLVQAESAARSASIWRASAVPSAFAGLRGNIFDR